MLKQPAPVHSPFALHLHLRHHLLLGSVIVSMLMRLTGNALNLTSLYLDFSILNLIVAHLMHLKTQTPKCPNSL